MSIDAKKTKSLVHVLESLAPHAMPDREILHGSERRLFDQALAELSWHLRDLVFFFLSPHRTNDLTKKFEKVSVT